MQDRAPGGGWYCFDDTQVDPWDPACLDKDCYGGRFIPEGFTQACGAVWPGLVWCGVAMGARQQPVCDCVRLAAGVAGGWARC